MTCVNMQVKSRKSLIYVHTIQWQLKPGMAISPVPKSKKASTAVMVTVFFVHILYKLELLYLVKNIYYKENSLCSANM